MASIQFMSPHCNEAGLIAGLKPTTAKERATAGERMVARRLLLELRRLINPNESWNARDEMEALQHNPERQLWTLQDSTGLLGTFQNGQSIPGGIVSIEATLTTLGGSAVPHRLIVQQGPSLTDKAFTTLRGETALTALKTEFKFPALMKEHPLDALIATRGDFVGKPLRYLLNRYDS